LIEEFVQHVMASWREAGGEPDIALVLPTLLDATGFRLRKLCQEPSASIPATRLWQCPPASSTSISNVSWSWAACPKAGPAQVRRDLEEREADGVSLMVTPLVLEIVAGAPVTSRFFITVVTMTAW